MKATIVAMLAVLMMLTACKDKEPVTKEPVQAINTGDVMARVPILGRDVNVEDCWTVFELEQPGGPHAELNDQFCTEKEGPKLVLTPGENMGDWSPCADEEKIELTHVGGPLYRFCVKVADHDDKHTGNKHPSEHANFQIIFSLKLKNGYQEAAIIGIGSGAAGSALHGGTAHSQN